MPRCLRSPMAFVFLAFLSLICWSVEVQAGESLVCPRCARGYALAPKHCVDDGALLRRQIQQARACPDCPRVFVSGELFCPDHGRRLVAAKPAGHRCPDCGKRFSKGETFCPRDGRRLVADANELTRPSGVAAPEIARAGPKDASTPGKASPEPAAGKAEDTRRRLSLSFTATTTSTAVLPLKIYEPGKLGVRVRFSGDERVLILVYGPNHGRPIGQRAGESPLDFEVEVPKTALGLGERFELWVVRQDGRPALGEVDLRIPGGAAAAAPAVGPAPVGPGAVKGKALAIAKANSVAGLKGLKAVPKGRGGSRFALKKGKPWFRDIEASREGRLEIQLRFPKGKELVAVLIDRKTRKKLAEVRGKAPLQLFAQATPKRRSFRLLLVDFRNQSIEGEIRVIGP